MSQGFISKLPIPLPTGQGGTGSTSATGTGINVLATSPTITTPLLSGIVNGGISSAGYVGEVLSTLVLSGSGTLIGAFETPQNVMSLVLTPGDWDLWGNVNYTSSVDNAVQSISTALSTVSATYPNTALYVTTNTTGTGGTLNSQCLPTLPMNITTNTTIYMVSYVAGTSGTITACGGIYARRRR